MLRLIAFLLLATLASATFGADPGDTARFTQLENDWHAAIKAQDRDALERFLAPDYTLTVAGAEKLHHVERGEWLKNAGSVYVLHDFRFDEVVVRRYGDTAIVSSRYTQRATVNGKDRSADFFLTDVWVRSNGTWQVSARYSSRPEVRKPKPPG